ncbi:hypothetical protein STEG23_028169, partial [Scotinomys teguina]
MTITPLGLDQHCSLKIRELDVLAPWFLDPGGWSKTSAVSLYFIFPGICTLSLAVEDDSVGKLFNTQVGVLNLSLDYQFPHEVGYNTQAFNPNFGEAEAEEFSHLDEQDNRSMQKEYTEAVAKVDIGPMNANQEQT